ncbi:alpha/beta fold hydrolase [Spiractinospora alimapuensis]|uniref:alpha/beta fold hydrolase n=1 Tax=Spiractinospora alimapuensis TaxID=2820884 RepID=UPI001F1872CF|nr:alpha/beta fold hydrolase [Spiractinospora alimapuensis]QVQ51463.1 alpha/beta fold hydrolase [Spiractinospora alimapuensis]
MRFVLVHGGWHGAWCWERLVPLMREAGATVHTPSLTGVGERAADATPDVNVSTHIADVVEVLEEEDLSDVVLVGHSYAGFVITGVADRVPERIRHLVYLDAVVPREGKSVADVLPPLNKVVPWATNRYGDGWLMPHPPLNMGKVPGVHGFYGVTDETDLKWISANITPQPVRTFTEPYRGRTTGLLESLPRTYVHCTGGGRLVQWARRPRRAFWPPRDPGWQHRRLATGHNAMITAPAELADLLLGL